MSTATAPSVESTIESVVTVELTPFEMFWGAQVGISRQSKALQKGLADQYGLDPAKAWGVHVLGAQGELALAKWLGIYWNGTVGELGRSDVGPLEVRTSTRLDADLIVRPRDPDRSRFVLVTGVAPTFRLAGWLSASEAKTPGWSDTRAGRPAAYFIPQMALRSMFELGEAYGRP